MSLKTSASTNSLYSTNGNGNNGSNASYTKGHQRNSSYDSVGSQKKDYDEDRLLEFLNSKGLFEVLF